MFHPASLLFRRFQINAGGHKLLRKKQMAFIDFLGNLPAYGGQIASWQLPPVSRRICQRQRVISFEGKKNGGLEMSFKTADRV